MDGWMDGCVCVCLCVKHIFCNFRIEKPAEVDKEFDAVVPN